MTGHCDHLGDGEGMGGMGDNGGVVEGIAEDGLVD